MVHYVSNIVDTAEVHIILTGDDRAELTLHLILNDLNGIR